MAEKAALYLVNGVQPNYTRAMQYPYRQSGVSLRFRKSQNFEKPHQKPYKLQIPFYTIIARCFHLVKGNFELYNEEEDAEMKCLSAAY